MAEYNDVWVFCEEVEGRLRSISLELITKGRELADTLNEKLVAVLIGHGVNDLSSSLIHQGAHKVLIADDEVFSDYTTDAYSIILSSMIEKYKPSILLLGANATGRDLAPRVAARLQVGLASDCVGLEINENRFLVQTRPSFGGKVMAQIISPTARPQIATVRPNVFKSSEPDTFREGAVENFEIQIDKAQIRTEVLEKVKEASEGMKSVEEADIVVCSGRGIKDPANLELPTKLADLLDAAVGGSRPIVDLGWLPPTQQVGQSGRTICPKLYFALGISGAIQHLAGMSRSDIIVAVNKDPDAPIFEITDFGIVGDLFDILPELIGEIEKVHAKR